MGLPSIASWRSSSRPTSTPAHGGGGGRTGPGPSTSHEPTASAVTTSNATSLERKVRALPVERALVAQLHELGAGDLLERPAVLLGEVVGPVPDGPLAEGRALLRPG